MKKRLGLYLLILVLITMSLSACGKSEDTGGGSVDSDVIKIGVFEPMTGANAAGGGEMTVEGIKLANEVKGGNIREKGRISNSR